MLLTLKYIKSYTQTFSLNEVKSSVLKGMGLISLSHLE